MMMLDQVRLLAGSLGLSLTVTVKKEQRNGFSTPMTSEAGALLSRIEKHFAIVPPRTGSLGQRFARCEMFANSNLSLKKGDRVVTMTPGLPTLDGREGLVEEVKFATNGALVLLDGDKRGPRFFNLHSIRKVNITMSIATRIAAAISGFILTAKPTTAIVAIRELAAATVLCSKGDAAKKRAKKALVDLGITLEEYRPGTITAYEDTEFLVQAVTKEPSSRLDQAILTGQLRSAGLSQAKITAAFKSATVENKAATSIVVTEK